MPAATLLDGTVFVFGCANKPKYMGCFRQRPCWRIYICRSTRQAVLTALYYYVAQFKMCVQHYWLQANSVTPRGMPSTLQWKLQTPSVCGVLFADASKGVPAACRGQSCCWCLERPEGLAQV